ncbi:hypothetical protein MASR2M70_03730 [Bacillota bacterium]
MVIKRRKGIPILILGILLVVVAGALFFGNQFLFNRIGDEERQAIDYEVDAITQAIMEDIVIARNSGPESSEEEGQETVVTEPSEPEKNPADMTARKDAEIAKTIAAYENGLAKLKTEGDSIVDRLVVEIKAEYQAMKASNAGKVDLLKLAGSYTGKAKAYEESLDKSVEALAVKMKEDLLTAGMAEKEAQDYINGIKDEYKKQKDERRKLMLDKAKQYL